MSLQRQTPMKRASKPMARTRMKRTAQKRKAKPEPNGFPEETRMAVRRRSGGRCEARLAVCTGDAAHFHHRKLRRHKDHRVVNGLHVCSMCHQDIHANPTKSYLLGLLVHSWLDPAEVPVRRS